MNGVSQVYRQACREIGLPMAEQRLFLRLLREMSINAARQRKAWQMKEDFITLWFISAGRFRELAASPFCGVIIGWVAGKLSFKLNEEELELLQS